MPSTSDGAIGVAERAISNSGTLSRMDTLRVARRFKFSTPERSKRATKSRKDGPKNGARISKFSRPSGTQNPHDNIPGVEIETPGYFHSVPPGQFSSLRRLNFR